MVDNLASAVRAGLSLPEALAALAVRGPEVLRPPFARFAAEYRSTGRFGACLDRLKDELADPVGDRIVETLRVAREVGGTDLGPGAADAGHLPARGRPRPRRAGDPAGLGGPGRAARRRRAVGGAAAAGHPVDDAGRLRLPAGTAILLGGGAVCLVAYRLMLRIGRLPEDVRVLQ